MTDTNYETLTFDDYLVFKEEAKIKGQDIPDFQEWLQQEWEKEVRDRYNAETKRYLAEVRAEALRTIRQKN